VQPAAHPAGTTVEVRDLFHRVPARRKFLRAESTEFQHVLKTMTRLALSRFDVAFTLMHNRREHFALPPAPGRAEREARIARLVGADFLAASRHVAFAHAGFGLEGWIGLPSASRAQPDRQFLFVNGRMVRDRLLGSAVRLGYRDVSHGERHPAWVLYLSLDPLQLDVNAHPQKLEVRFRDARAVNDFLFRAVERALAEAGAGARGSAPVVVEAWGAAPRSPGGLALGEPGPASAFDPHGTQDSAVDAPREGGPLGEAIAQLHGIYVLAQSPRGWSWSTCTRRTSASSTSG
jgi:DNA mismatch repair protein MutL